MRSTLLNAKTAAATSDADFSSDRRPDRTFQATVSGSGAVSATVIIEGSNEDSDNATFLTIGTITLSGTDSDSDGFAMSAGWARTRARLTAISGTGAAVTVTMGA